MIELKLQNLSGPLPTATYEILYDKQTVGKIQLRHQPSKSSDVPNGFESHIYYEINSDQRGKGYAKEALRLVVKEAETLGMKELILNIEEDNTASQKVAEANAAKLLDKEVGNNGKTYLKYGIQL